MGKRFEDNSVEGSTTGSSLTIPAAETAEERPVLTHLPK